MPESANRESSPPALSGLVLRGGVGGVLMGLANLVPGISGGTMLLAAGIYPMFIAAVAEISTLRFRPRSIILLATVFGAAALAILLLAGTVRTLVINHRWIMYSLFIGLTLGGIPMVCKLIRQGSRSTWMGTAFGFAAMAFLGWLQMTGRGATNESGTSILLLFIAGGAGASAMILPGVSGGYLLLVLGQYLPILAAIDRIRGALPARDVSTLLEAGLEVILPVGLGVVIGIAVVSNLLRWCLNKARQATLGVLLGLLIGAVVGLWPFQEGSPPEVGTVYKGQVVTEEGRLHIAAEDFPTRTFPPTGRQAAAALLLLGVGFAGTSLVARLGNTREETT